MKRPRIGALRERVILEALAASPDGAGGRVRTWAPVAEMWAAVTAGSTDAWRAEAPEPDGLAGRLTRDVTIRWREGVAPAQRFRLGARVLEITAVIDLDERRRFLTCHCMERDL